MQMTLIQFNVLRSSFGQISNSNHCYSQPWTVRRLVSESITTVTSSLSGPSDNFLKVIVPSSSTS